MMLNSGQSCTAPTRMFVPADRQDEVKSIAKAAAERVRRTFEAAGVTVEGQDLNATVSIGAACGEPGTDIVALLAAADAALYRAKASGRNRVELAQEADRPAAMPVLFASAGAPARAKSTDAALIGALDLRVVSGGTVH